MPRNVWNDIVSWRTERRNNSTKYQFHALTTIKKEELKSVGELSNVCSQIVLKCLFLARIGRPDILWSVNKFARSITKWTKACDKRLSRLISHVHHTSEYKQCCHVGNNAKQCNWDCFRTPILQEILRTRNLRQVEHCVFLEVLHLFQSVGCVRNKLQFRTVHHFFWCRIKDGRYTRLFYGIWSSSQFFTETRIRMIKYGKTRINLQRERKFMERFMI